MVKGHAEATVLAGPAVDRLVSAVDQWSITDVVVTSHGRTGLSRVILGSVADALIHRLHCPIVIVPALAPEGAEASEQTRQGDSTTAPV